MLKQTKILLLFIFLFSCSPEDPDSMCNPENPFKMEWISEWIGELQHCTCIISIFQAEYIGESVFWQLMTDPLCQSVIENVPVFNCLGEEILVLEDYQDWVEFNKNVEERKIIYACPNNRT